MGLLSSKKIEKKCAVCGGEITEKMPVGDLCSVCFRQCVQLSAMLRYLQNTSIENLTAIQNLAAQDGCATIPEEIPDDNSVARNKPLIQTYKIIRPKTGEEFILFGAISKIGKSSEMADIVIADNNTLSRCHALLEKTADGVVLSDCNSKNGTRFGKEKLLPGQKVLLHSGDTFMLSNETLVLMRE